MPDGPTRLDFAVDLLRKQSGTLINIFDGLLDERNKAWTTQHAMAMTTHVARLDLARDLVEGLVTSAKNRHSAASHVLFRAVWESLLNVLYFLQLPDDVNAGFVNQHSARVSVRLSRLDEGRWDYVGIGDADDQGIHKNTRLSAVRKRYPAVAQILDKAHDIYYADTSGVVHADLQGAMSTSIGESAAAAIGLSRDPPLESLILWASLLIHGVLGQVTPTIGGKNAAFDASATALDKIQSLLVPSPKGRA